MLCLNQPRRRRRKRRCPVCERRPRWCIQATFPQDPWRTSWNVDLTPLLLAPSPRTRTSCQDPQTQALPRCPSLRFPESQCSWRTTDDRRGHAVPFSTDPATVDGRIYSQPQGCARVLWGHRQEPKPCVEKVPCASDAAKQYGRATRSRTHAIRFGAVGLVAPVVQTRSHVHRACSLAVDADDGQAYKGSHVKRVCVSFRQHGQREELRRRRGRDDGFLDEDKRAGMVYVLRDCAPTDEPAHTHGWLCAAKRRRAQVRENRNTA
ncbi:hypothetical protein DFH11DRAFT_1620945 [Phellopilus nigrolimitatus]|nr:hypothetical protein DFH11DRAFT_1620945 [Phellopilus nigrolimitatus]